MTHPKLYDANEMKISTGMKIPTQNHGNS